MKILFLTDNFPPEVNAPASRTYEHCKVWVTEGAEVTVITCHPNFPQGKLFNGYKNKLYSKEILDGIKVIRVWSYIAPNAGFVKRILDFQSYAFMAFWTGLFQKTDIIIGTSPQFFTAVSARILSFFKRTPWIMEVRDLWPESIAAVGAMDTKSLQFRFLVWLEYHLYRSAKKIIVVTDSFKKTLVNNGIDSNKVKVVKNGVLLDDFKPKNKSRKLLETYNLSGKFIIGYVGTHGMAHGLDFIIKSAPNIISQDIHFILLGDGAEKRNLIELAKNLKITNITFLPFVQKEEVREFLSILDASLVNLRKADTFKNVIPSKIFENASMLKPILLGVEGESRELIEFYNAGICFEPENEKEFLRSIHDIKDVDVYNRLQQGAMKLAKDYDRVTLAKSMLKEIKSLLNDA